MNLVVSWKTDSLKMLISHLWYLKVMMKVLSSPLMKMFWQGADAAAETLSEKTSELIDHIC